MATAGVALTPSGILHAQNNSSAAAPKAVPGKVKIAYIGIGNRGNQIIGEFKKTNMVDVVALCDVDIKGKQCDEVKSWYPNAKQFTDFRELFDKAGNEFDAVAIAVPDFAHFPIAMLALSEGKHVYVEKPMARTFNEEELMIQAALKRPNQATQVGNQGHSEGNYFQFKAWKEAGIIKDVTAVTAHMNSWRRWHPFPDDYTLKFPAAEPLPDGMNWDTWLNTAAWHEYCKDFHQGQWRCWYDFGMGALGDWGAHLLDTVHEFLELGLPYEITLQKAERHNDYFYPNSSTILFRFGARKDMPPVDVTWYDGLDNLPPIPEGFGVAGFDPNVPATNVDGKGRKPSLAPGKIIYSKDLTFKGGSHGSTLNIIPKEKIAEVESKFGDKMHYEGEGKFGNKFKLGERPSNHFENFLLACQGIEKTRSPFEICGVLCEVFSLGVIAQRLNTQLFFDARTKQFTNNAFANAMLVGIPPRKGWEQFYKL